MLNIRCIILPAVYCRPFVSKEVFWAISKDFEFSLVVFLLLTPLLQCYLTGAVLTLSIVTRQMKTITYSLASTKCMEEGWTVRPESPSLSDGEQIQDPFVIEVNPLQLVSTSHRIEMNCCEVRGIYHETQNRKTADGNESIKKTRLAKKQLCTCITLFCTLLCRHGTTVTWSCQLSRFVENVNKRRRISLPLFELEYFS